MIVVGLSGYSGAGKDAVADILVSDYGFTKMAFAAPLKAMVRKLDPIIGYDLYAGCCNECADIPEVTEIRFSDAAQYGFDDESLKHSPWAEEVRRLWQHFGTELYRSIDEDTWIELAEEAAKESRAERIVFTDVRFENEAEWIYSARQLDGYKASVWRVARPEQRGQFVHESERMAGLLDEEVTILNDGSLEDLALPVSLAMHQLMTELPGQTSLNLDELARELGLWRDRNEHKN